MLGLGLGISKSGVISGISAEAITIYNRIIADNGVSNLTRLNFFVKGLKAIYGDLANVPVCYDAHWIGYKLGSGIGATAGQAAAKLYSLTVAGDAVQGIAANQPLLLAHNGASSDNYWFGSGVNGNACTTPHASANDITGDIEIIIKINYVSSSSTQTLISKRASVNTQYSVGILASGALYCVWSIGGTDRTTDNSISISSGFNGFIKITRIQSTGEVKYFTSTDGITYTLRATLPTTAGNLDTINTTLKVGADASSLIQSSISKIYRATIANSIGGTPVVDFNAATYNASTSQTQWTSATGEVWTINTGTATTGYKGVLVNRTMVQGDGVDDHIGTGSFISLTQKTVYAVVNPFVNAFGYLISDNLSPNNTSPLVKAGIANTFGVYNNTTYVRTDVTTTTLMSFVASQITSAGVQLAQVNNGASNTNSGLTPFTQTGVRMFARGDTGGKANAIINTVVFINLADNLTTRTATYNLIRSLNNNAF
jgi:hypothetical protein